MARSLKIIPTLHGHVANRFSKTAADNDRIRESVNFTVKVRIVQAILKKSKINS